MDVQQPHGLADALVAVAEDPSATVLAGGTDLMVAVNEGTRPVERVISLRGVRELAGWRDDGADVVIGAGTTYAAMLEGDLGARLPALAQAARTVGSPQIRNAGTLGGNLATASPAGDTLPVLLALGASVEVAGPGGVRLLPVGEFLVGPKRTALEPGELITGVRVPRRPGPQEYLKVGVRNAMVIAVASVAFAADVAARSITVGLGSVGPTVLGAPAACDWLAERVDWDGGGFVVRDPAAVMEFGRRVRAAAAPIADHRSTAAYRAHAIGVLAQRAAARAALAPGEVAA